MNDIILRLNFVIVSSDFAYALKFITQLLLVCDTGTKTSELLDPEFMSIVKVDHLKEEKCGFSGVY